MSNKAYRLFFYLSIVIVLLALGKDNKTRLTLGLLLVALYFINRIVPQRHRTIFILLASIVAVVVRSV